MFEVGDVVCLKRNPKKPMTVSFIFGEVETSGFFEKRYEKMFRRLGYSDGDVQCAWFDGPEYKVDFFTAKTLKTISNTNTRPVLEEYDVVCLRSNPEMLLSVSIVLGKTKLCGFREKRIVKKLPNFGFKDGDVQCLWVNNQKIQLAFIRAEMLVKKYAG